MNEKSTRIQAYSNTRNLRNYCLKGIKEKHNKMTTNILRLEIVIFFFLSHFNFFYLIADGIFSILFIKHENLK